MKFRIRRYYAAPTKFGRDAVVVYDKPDKAFFHYKWTVNKTPYDYSSTYLRENHNWVEISRAEAIKIIGRNEI